MSGLESRALELATETSALHIQAKVGIQSSSVSSCIWLSIELRFGLS